MRSGSVAWLLEKAGIDVIKLEGGYKAYRKWARMDFAAIPDLRILGGMTGVGKTKILKSMQDLGRRSSIWRVLLVTWVLLLAIWNAHLSRLQNNLQMTVIAN